MKKLMFMFAALTLACGVQAASVSWQVSGASAYKGETVYAITGLTSAQVIAYFSSTTASDWSKGVEGAVSASISNRGAASSVSENAGSTIVYAIVKTGIAEGNDWLVTGDISTSGFTYTPPATAPGTLAVAASAFTNTGKFTAESSGGAPEPTSGLLLLVGAGMLALRRKQK